MKPYIYIAKSHLLVKRMMGLSIASTIHHCMIWPSQRWMDVYLIFWLIFFAHPSDPEVIRKLEGFNLSRAWLLLLIVPALGNDFPSSLSLWSMTHQSFLGQTYLTHWCLLFVYSKKSQKSDCSFINNVGFFFVHEDAQLRNDLGFSQITK